VHANNAIFLACATCNDFFIRFANKLSTARPEDVRLLIILPKQFQLSSVADSFG